MTHAIYTHQHLQLKSIARLKQIYSEIGCTIKATDKRCKDAWISAITDYQSTQVQKVAPAAPDDQTLAQAELNHFITDQAQAVAPEKLTTVEISFYDHEIYCGDKLIAAITHDHTDFVTQRWVVMVKGAEIHRANTPMLCHRYICIHYKDGTLPVQEQNAIDTPCTTGNEVMAQVAAECEKYELEILDDGIYRDDVKLGEVGYTDAHWWVIRATEGNRERIACDSALEAVWWLAMEDVLQDAEADCEELLDRPVDELTASEWERLRQFATFTEEPELIAA